MIPIMLSNLQLSQNETFGENDYIMSESMKKITA